MKTLFKRWWVTGPNAPVKPNPIPVVLLAALLWLPKITSAQPTITTPADGSSFPAGANVAVSASVPGGATNFVFALDGVPRIARNSPPYDFTLGDLPPGPHVLQGTAYYPDPTPPESTSPINLTGLPPAGFAALVPNGSQWQYLEGHEDPGTEWKSVFYDDSASNQWSTGTAELGYGDIANGRPEATTIGSFPHPVTTYFRHTFLVPDPSAFTGLELRLLRDDGAVVYLNGVEVFRSNMNPTNDIAFNTLAESMDLDDGQNYVVVPVAPRYLIPGPNVIAVEVHQAASLPDDMSFDLMLLGIAGTHPPSDCNGNGTDDALDITNGTSFDSNGDGVPDECQAELRLEQASFVDAGGTLLQQYSDYGMLTIRAIQPSAHRIAWANVLYQGQWVVQNLPLLSPDCVPTLTEYNVSFSLDVPVGTPVTSAQLSWAITPQPLSVSPPASLGALVSVTEKRVYPSSSPASYVSAPLDTNGVPVAPLIAMKAANFTNAAGTDVKSVVRRGVPAVSEDVNGCGPGAGARCLGWLNSEYKLGLTTNAQSIYETLKDTNHMKALPIGTYTTNLDSGMRKYIGEKGLTNKLTVTSRFFTNSSFSLTSSNLFNELKAGQDVIMYILYYSLLPVATNNGVVTSNWVPTGAHYAVATEGTMETNGQATIKFQDDAFGGDKQGDGKKDGGKTKTSTFRIWDGTTNLWIMEGFGSWGVFGGYLTVCPDSATQAKALKNAVSPGSSSSSQGIKNRIDQYYSGSPPTPIGVRELAGWVCDLRDTSEFLLHNLELNGMKPSIKYAVADVQTGWGARLHDLTVQYSRTLNSSLLTEMHHLAGKITLSSGLIYDCLVTPGCESSSLPAISISLAGSLVRVDWPTNSQLQSAADILGPWTTISNVLSPHFFPANENHRFFRTVADDDNCIYGIKSVISGNVPPGDFLCIRPSPTGDCPAPVFENGKWQLIIVNQSDEEIGRVEVSSTGTRAPCEAVSAFTTVPAVWVDTVAGKIRTELP